jgi:hypothetical protein
MTEFGLDPVRVSTLGIVSFSEPGARLPAPRAVVVYDFEPTGLFSDTPLDPRVPWAVGCR